MPEYEIAYNPQGVAYYKEIDAKAPSETIVPMNTKAAHAMSSSIAGTDTKAEATVPLPPQMSRESKRPRSMLGRVRDYVRQAGRYLPTVVDIGNSAQKAGYVSNPYLKTALSIGNVLRNATDPKKKAEMESESKMASKEPRSKRVRHPSNRTPVKTSSALVQYKKPFDLEGVD